MKIANDVVRLLAAFGLVCSVSVDAFGVRPEQGKVVTERKVSWEDALSKALCSGLVAVTVWSTPNLPFAPVEVQSVAVAKEMASGSGSRVNKDADSLLRYGLPIKNKEVSG